MTVEGGLERAEPLSEFVAGIRDMTASEAIMAALVRYMRPYGMDVVAVGELPSEGSSRIRPFFHSTWPKAWFDIYIGEGIAAADALLPRARRSMLPFSWSEITDELIRFGETRKDLRVLDLCRDFGWTDGLAVPIHGPDDYHGLVSYAGSPKSLGDRERIALHILAYYAHERLLALHESDPKGRRIMAVKAAGLSAREREALHLLGTGLTDREVAEQLGVAERTALYYVQSARRKLGCRTRAHLMVEAARLGLLR